GGRRHLRRIHLDRRHHPERQGPRYRARYQRLLTAAPSARAQNSRILPGSKSTLRKAKNARYMRPRAGVLGLMLVWGVGGWLVWRYVASQASPYADKDLTRGVFAGQTLTGKDFSKSVLMQADFTNALLQNALFRNANLYGAKMRGANLTN